MIKEFKIGETEVMFSHTAVNFDAHLFIDGSHDPALCPECIRPGTLVFTKDTPPVERPILTEHEEKQIIDFLETI